MRSRIRFFILWVVTSLSSLTCMALEPPDSLCLSLLRSLPDFPNMASICGDNIHFQRSDSFRDSKESPLFIIVTNRELVRGRQRLHYSDNCAPRLSYIAVYRHDDEYRLQTLPDLQEALPLLPDTRETLLYVHGYGRTFTNILNESETIRRFYNVSLIVFDWPSKYPGVFELKSYLYSKGNVDRSMPLFLTFLKEYEDCQKIYPDFGADKTTILLHSMGNAFLEKMIRKKKYDPVHKPLFDVALLNAPAVRKRGHRKWIKETRLANQIVVLTNHKDPTLYGVFWLTLRKQLGRSRENQVRDGIRYVNLGNIAKGHHNYFINQDLMRVHPSLKILYFSLISHIENDKLEECRLAEQATH